MAKKEQTVDGTVCKPILHEGQHCPVGSDLELPLATARMLENSKRFTTDRAERTAVKKRAKASEERAKAAEEDSASADPK